MNAYKLIFLYICFNFTCHPDMSPVTCHMSLMQTATAMVPPPANFSTMHSRLVWKTKQKYIFFFCRAVLAPFWAQNVNFSFHHFSVINCLVLTLFNGRNGPWKNICKAKSIFFIKMVVPCEPIMRFGCYLIFRTSYLLYHTIWLEAPPLNVGA